MIISAERRQDFSAWLRTGRWPRRGSAGGLEFKFNPYHDPATGQFTSADGSDDTVGFTPTTRLRQPGSKVSYVSDPDKAPISTIAEADAWRASELAAHGGDPTYAAAINARYETYRDAFSRSSTFDLSIGDETTSADRISVDNDSFAASAPRDNGGDNNFDNVGDPGTEPDSGVGSTPAATSSRYTSSQSQLHPLDRPQQVAFLAASGPEYSEGRGSNSRAFEDPMTLEQAVPGLQNAPGGAILAVADTLFDLTGPANAFTTQFLQDQAKHLTAQIKRLNPHFHYDELGPTDASGTPIVTIQGLQAKVDDLRFERAAVMARVRGDYAPLQVETLRFVQQRADDSYDKGVGLLKAGRLTPRLSDREAVGNYVDQRVRVALRERYAQLNIDSAGKGPVRVNRREDDTSGDDLTYRRPDARVNEVAYDVTLTRKTLATAQVRGFFNTDFRPTRVVIIRPSQLGDKHTYVLSRPEAKR